MGISQKGPYLNRDNGNERRKYFGRGRHDTTLEEATDILRKQDHNVPPIEYVVEETLAPVGSEKPRKSVLVPPKKRRRLRSLLALGAASVLGLSLAHISGLDGKIISYFGSLPTVESLDSPVSEAPLQEDTFVINIPGQGPIKPYSLTIQNKGKSDIKNFWMWKDGSPNFYSIQTLLDGIIKPQMSEEEKALAIWRIVTDYRYHGFAAEPNIEAQDPLKMFQVYGYGLCFDTAQVVVNLANQAGLRARTRCLGTPESGGHVISEILIGGIWRVIDADIGVIHKKTDGSIASLDDLVRNPGLIDIGTHKGFDDLEFLQEKLVNIYRSSDPSKAGAFEAAQDKRYFLPNMSISLKEGASIRFFWDNPLDFHGNSPMDGLPGGTRKDAVGRKPKKFSTGILKVPFSGEDLNRGVNIQIPYVFLGGEVYFDGINPSGSGFTILTSDAGKLRRFKLMEEIEPGLAKTGFFETEDPRFWTQIGTVVNPEKSFSLRPVVNNGIEDLPAVYQIYLKAPPSAGKKLPFSSATFRVPFQLAPTGLPPISLGENRFFYYTNSSLGRIVSRGQESVSGDLRRVVAESPEVKISFDYQEN